MSVWSVALVCAIVLLLCWLFWPSTRVVRSVPTPPQQSIFVVVPRGMDVARIFEACAFPQRVFVGLGTPHEYSCQHSIALAPPRPGRLRAPAAGAAAAVPQRTVLAVLDPNLSLHKGWDQDLLQNFSGSVSVVTQWPGQTERRNSTFPVLHTYSDSWPVFTGVTAEPAARARAFQVPVATWHCLALPHAMIELVQQPPLPFVTSTEDSLLLSFVLWQKRVRVFAPNVGLVFRSSDSTSAHDPCVKELRTVTVQVLASVLLDDKKAAAESYYDKWLHKTRKGAEFLRWLGLDDGRARFGLLPNYGTADILARYPSMTVFHAPKRTRSQNESPVTSLRRLRQKKGFCFGELQKKNFSLQFRMKARRTGGSIHCAAACDDVRTSSRFSQRPWIALKPHDFGEIALHVAAKRGHVKSFFALLRANPKTFVRRTRVTKLTAFQLALQGNKRDILKGLLEAQWLQGLPRPGVLSYDALDLEFALHNRIFFVVKHIMANHCQLLLSHNPFQKPEEAFRDLGEMLEVFAMTMHAEDDDRKEQLQVLRDILRPGAPCPPLLASKLVDLPGCSDLISRIFLECEWPETLFNSLLSERSLSPENAASLAELYPESRYVSALENFLTRALDRRAIHRVPPAVVAILARNGVANRSLHERLRTAKLQIPLTPEALLEEIIANRRTEQLRTWLRENRRTGAKPQSCSPARTWFVEAMVGATQRPAPCC